MLPVKPFVVPVRANEIDAVWSEAAPLIRLAQKRIERSTGMADIYGDLTSERTMLWLVRIEDKLQAVIITEIAKHPRRSAWRILLIGGSGMSEWLEYSIEAMKRAAKIAGCSAIEADGRLGWAKIAPRCGFKEVTRAYEMEI
jgi:hypothetical protein